MLHFALGVSRLDNIRNQHIRRTMLVCQFADKARKVTLGWSGQIIQRRDEEYVERRTEEEERKIKKIIIWMQWRRICPWRV